MTSTTLRSNTFPKFALVLFATMFVAGSSYSQTPRGNRVLGLDVNPYDNQNPSSDPYSGAVADAIAHGVTTVSLHLKWNQIECIPGQSGCTTTGFTGPDATNWQNAIAAYRGYPLNLMLVIGTLDTCQRDVPPDLAQVSKC